jgi:hypothetical protein
MRKRLLLVATVAMVTLSGCTMHWTNIDAKPNGADSAAHYSSASTSSGHECLAVMDDLQTIFDSQETNASVEFQKRLLRHIKGTGVFNSVAEEMPAAKPDRWVNFALKSNEAQDTNQGSNMVKGFFIGFTFWLLPPVLPLSYDFESDMTLHATRWDGKSRSYHAKGGGNAKYHYFANPAAAGSELRAQITNNNINSLMSQLVQDAGFLCPQSL